MNLVKAFFHFIFKIFKTQGAEIKHVQRLSAFDTVLIKPSREASDDLLKYGTILIVKDGSIQKWARFICPCGCGQKQVISLQASHSPHWSLNTIGETITLHPSVHVNGTDGCEAHFFIRKNQIEWV
jgi:hypothetical protein